MNTLMTAITIITLSVCSAGKYTIDENRTVEKNPRSQNEKVIIYKKVPTKWVKIPKKSN